MIKIIDRGVKQPIPRPRTPKAAQLKRWKRLCRELHSPGLELTIEEFAPLLATFRALQRLGMTFDPTLAALMDVLQRQALNTPDDSDSENDDAFADVDDGDFEYDDPDADTDPTDPLAHQASVAAAKARDHSATGGRAQHASGMGCQ